MSADEAALWRKAKEVLLELEEVGESDRRDAVERACAGDPELRAEVLSLLAASAPERDRVGQTRQALDRALSVKRGPERWLGHTLDGFRVLEPIGQGGMGFVYLGRRAEGGDPVAIKLLDRRFAHASTLQRFDLEREGLDRLDHPGISRLLATGATSEGDPYYVMEYVHGAAIDSYADDLRLSVRERVRLLLRVFPAVAHAHARGIIHRDLKPSNILVEPSGDPRLLDFGIAKMLDADAGGAPSQLSIEAPAFTLYYASPEHLDGEPVSPASDVYSLGALAYQLLAGSYPRAKAPGKLYTLAELLGSLGPKAEQVAQARGVTPSALREELSGDLDRVLSRACERAPEQRYQTVLEMATELEGWVR